MDEKTKKTSLSMESVPSPQSLKHADTPVTLESCNSNSFGFSTPTKSDGREPDATGFTTRTTSNGPIPMLSSLFVDDGFDVPSPPTVNGKVVEMELTEVDNRMRGLGFVPPGSAPSFLSPLRQLVQLSDTDYKKMAYVIGKGVDKEIIRQGPWGWPVTIRKLLNENCAIGKRFAALYKSDGDAPLLSEGKSTG